MKDKDALPQRPAPWEAGEKIPWHEPAFSQRMLEHHLSQEHDWASRRENLIDHHVTRIAELLSGKTSRILDLGCGPGLYAQRLAKLGHDCVGIDFSPASIAYAREQAHKAGLSIPYELADVRKYEAEGRFDLVMMVFGEFNVFRETQARALLSRAASWLEPGGTVLIEASTYEAVFEDGHRPETLTHQAQGLFSDQPHTCFEEHFWDGASTTATTRYSILEASSREPKIYGSSSKAYTEAQYRQMLIEAGLPRIRLFDAEEWPSGDPFKGKFLTLAGSSA